MEANKTMALLKKTKIVNCPKCGTFAGRCSYDDACEVARCGITGEKLA